MHALLTPAWLGLYRHSARSTNCSALLREGVHTASTPLRLVGLALQVLTRLRKLLKASLMRSGRSESQRPKLCSAFQTQCKAMQLGLSCTSASSGGGGGGGGGVGENGGGAGGRLRSSTLHATPRSAAALEARLSVLHFTALQCRIRLCFVAREAVRVGRPCCQPPAPCGCSPVGCILPAGQAGQANTPPRATHLRCGAHVGEHGNSSAVPCCSGHFSCVAKQRLPASAPRPAQALSLPFYMRR